MSTHLQVNNGATLAFWLLIMLALSPTNGQENKPHIVIIMADDLGFNDVSFRGSNKFLTPNIDALAYSGVILNNLYTPAMCTPSRAALLTGKYPINTGMQHYVIPNDQPWGLPLDETTMAQIFQQHGYQTSLLGKWHLGMARQNFTPTKRGFDHHLGYLGAYVDYFDHTYKQQGNSYARGHDFRNDLKVSREHLGDYVTDVLTDAAVELIEKHNASSKPIFLLLSHLAPHAGNMDAPMQAPQEELAKFAYMQNETERYYAAMVSRLDKSVGLVIDALARRELLQQSIILFLSDNGGPTKGEHSTSASNYPLKGQKNTPWEGGLRSSAAIWCSDFEHLGSVWTQRFYIGDLLPSLAAAAGITLNSSLRLDGLNLWSALKYGYQAVERDIVHNIDNLEPYLSYTRGKWKLVNGTTRNGNFDGWLGEPTDDATDPRAAHYEELIRNTSVWQQLQRLADPQLSINISALRETATLRCAEPSDNAKRCEPLLAPCLFDIDEDPCERSNLYELHSNESFVLDMWSRIEQFSKQARAPANLPADPRCDPKHYDFEWTWWLDEHMGNKAANKQTYLQQYLLIILLSFILL